mmetsp:Transcript_29477/g.67798  ORF Transcript_29477/g.67798 Transcript_29477/m.67798 type:complete len:224 (+) Transcript_29477:1866-2537(+)
MTEEATCCEGMPPAGAAACCDGMPPVGAAACCCCCCKTSEVSFNVPSWDSTIFVGSKPSAVIPSELIPTVLIPNGLMPVPIFLANFVTATLAPRPFANKPLGSPVGNAPIRVAFPRIVRGNDSVGAEAEAGAVEAVADVVCVTIREGKTEVEIFDALDTFDAFDAFNTFDGFDTTVTTLRRRWTGTTPPLAPTTFIPAAISTSVLGTDFTADGTTLWDTPGIS